VIAVASANKTLYIRDEDSSVWERAEEAAARSRQSVSQLVTTALRTYLPMIFTPEDEMEDIRVRVGAGVNHFGATIDEYRQLESFTGRWLVPPGDEAASVATRATTQYSYAVALTRRGQIAVYAYHPEALEPASLDPFPSLEAAGLPADIEEKAAEALGQQRIRWRDI
jgi:hypothetical protein